MIFRRVNKNRIANKILENVPYNHFTPRHYQLDLLDAALERNTIICTSDENTKSFIALFLIHNMSHDLQGEWPTDAKKTFFLTSDLQLNEVASYLSRHTDLKIGVGTSDLPNMSPEEAKELIQSNQVIVLSSASCLFLLEEMILQLDSVNVLIVNDCDQVLNQGNPVSMLMKIYGSMPLDKRPRLLGLSSTILHKESTEPIEIEEQLKRLEERLYAHAETSSHMLSMFTLGARPTERVVCCRPYVIPEGIGCDMETILMQTIAFIEDINCQEEDKPDCDNGSVDVLSYCKGAVKECMNILETLGVWCCSLIARVFLKHLLTLEETRGIEDEATRILRYTATQMAILVRLFTATFNKTMATDEFHKFVSPKVLQLVDQLRGYKPKTDFKIEVVEIQGSTDNPSDESSINSEGESGSSSFTSDDDTDDDMEGDPGGPTVRGGRGGRGRRRRGSVRSDRGKISRSHSLDSLGDGNAGSNSRLLYRAIALPPKQPSKSDQSYNQDRLSVIVLVESQFTAFALSRLMEELCTWDPDIFYLKPGHLYALPGPNREGVLNVRQEETIRKFRHGDLNVLMATRLVDCGLELPKCSLVVCFDPPPSFSAYLQSKSRSRVSNSTFLHLVEEGRAKEEFDEQYDRFRYVEDILMRRCWTHAVFADEGDVEDTEADAFLPPYQANGASPLPMSKAIGVVNRYCARLPSDSFTHLTPRWTLEKSPLNGKGDEMGYRCSIKLPINSPYKEKIVGALMPNKKLAKMAVALETVKCLHQFGELDSSLQPLAREDDTGVPPTQLPSEMDEVGNLLDPLIVGSTKRRQHYYKKMADQLVNCLPAPGEPFFLYFIDQKLASSLPEEQNRRGRPCYDPNAEPRGFAIISTKQMENIPIFPLFTRSGKETVELRCLTSNGVLNEEQLEKLFEFHHILFHAVLRLEKEAVMLFDMSSAYMNAIIAPVHGDTAEIDWSFVDLVSSSFCAEESVCKVPLRRDEEGKFVFLEEDFCNAVVMPSYRNFDQPQHYYVADIRYDLGPLCPFPSDSYTNFAEYFSKKYNAVLTNTSQPLLDVDFTAVRLNLLVPRNVNQKGLCMPTPSESKKRAHQQNLNQKQLLIPELCYLHPFPASVWRKAVCLPGVVYRLNHLLLAEDLRQRVVSEAGIGCAQLPPGCTFEPLEFEFPLGPPSDEGLEGAAREGSGYLAPAILSETKLEENLPEETEAEEMVDDIDCGDFRLVTNRQCSGEEEYLETDSDAESVDSFEDNIRFFPVETDDLDCDDVPEVKPEEDGNPVCPVICQPSPCQILQSLTMSCANDFFNLERMETIGDSFLKFAVTVHQFLQHPTAHEGRLSFLRSTQVCNSNLYRLGKLKCLGERMVSSKFEPHENWVPPGYVIRFDSRVVSILDGTAEGNSREVQLQGESHRFKSPPSKGRSTTRPDRRRGRYGGKSDRQVPYYLRIQHTLADKNLADCVEALIGCYLTTRGETSALRFMAWIGIECLPMGPDGPTLFSPRQPFQCSDSPLRPGSEAQLETLLQGCGQLEEIIQYKFKDRSFLLQAMTHASFHYNDITDCYQRLEFLGDAVLDYIITRFLYEDSKRHSPGVLTDLRSALVNNNIFAGLAVKWGFHRYFKCCSPDLLNMVDRFVRFQKEVNNDDLDFITSEEMEPRQGDQDETNEEEDTTPDTAVPVDELKQQQSEEIEIPKALGDIFESVAGAVYLDSGMSLDTVWRVFYRLMKERIERYTACIPKSPVRELLEMEPETAKFERPKRTGAGKIRVCAHVVGKGRFYGVGRNYRIAKSMAAKRALRILKGIAARASSEDKSP